MSSNQGNGSVFGLGLLPSTFGRGFGRNSSDRIRRRVDVGLKGGANPDVCLFQGTPKTAMVSLKGLVFFHPRPPHGGLCLRFSLVSPTNKGGNYIYFRMWNCSTCRPRVPRQTKSMDSVDPMATRSEPSHFTDVACWLGLQPVHHDQEPGLGGLFSCTRSLRTSEARSWPPSRLEMEAHRQISASFPIRTVQLSQSGRMPCNTTSAGGGRCCGGLCALISYIAFFFGRQCSLKRPPV